MTQAVALGNALDELRAGFGGELLTRDFEAAMRPSASSNGRPA